MTIEGDPAAPAEQRKKQRAEYLEAKGRSVQSKIHAKIAQEVLDAERARVRTYVSREPATIRERATPPSDTVRAWLRWGL